MKRLFILVALALAVMPVAGINVVDEDFQSTNNNIFTIADGTGTCTAGYGTPVENYYLDVYASSTAQYGAPIRCIVNSNYASPSSYWAFTYIGGTSGDILIAWYDATGSVIALRYIGSWASSGSTAIAGSFSAGDRLEFKLIGGDILWYKNGVYQGVAVANTVWSGVPPSYFGVGAQSWSYTTKHGYYDDIVIETDYLNPSITRAIDSPPQTWSLQKDPSTLAYGLFDATPTKIRTTPVYVRYFKEDDTAPATVTMVNSVGTIVDTKTVTDMAGVVTFDPGLLYSNTSPFGPVFFKLDGSAVKQGVLMSYAGAGYATATFNADTYGAEDVGIVTYDVTPAYWLPATNTYSLKILDAYGNTFQTTSLTTQSGTVSVDFTEAEPGVYYAVLVASSGGTDSWFAYDYAEVTSYIRFTGYTHDGEAEAALAGVNISIVQGSTVDNILSGFDGNYTSSATTAFGTGSLTTFTVSASGYQTSITSFTPMAAKTITKNITLIRSSPTCPVGICLGGLANETVYSRPVANVTIAVTNATYGESYSTSTNSVGWYNLGESDGVFLTNGRCYHVTASKTGYTGNTYLKCVVGT